MKAFIFTIFTSIFLSLNICNAQETKGQLSICNHRDNQIPLSEIKRFTEDGCGRLIYTDAEGNELKLTSYVWAISPEAGGNAYFEQVNGDMITNTIKARLSKVKAGDRIVIAQVNLININGTTGLIQNSDYVIVE